MNMPSPPPPSTPFDAIKNAAIRYRAICHNVEAGRTVDEQREWDDRVAIAEVELEKALLEAEIMHPDDAIESLEIVERDVRVNFEIREPYVIKT